MIRMTLIKTEDSKYLIPISTFDYCKLDGKTLEEICSLYPGRKGGAYKLDKFSRYLQEQHSLTIKCYVKTILKINWPKCPITQEETGYKVSGRGLTISKFKRGRISKSHCLKFNEACQKMSKKRTGSGNPMFGKKPWNGELEKGHPYRNAMASFRKGSKATDKTKIAQSESAKKRRIHGHTGHKHSQETIAKLRQNTARLWAEGRFNRTSSIHIKVREFLKQLDLSENFEEEYQVKYFSMDFAFPARKLAIECQGTYFHIDPRVYKNGPINAIQRRNFGRDKAKKKICCNQEGWAIIELWEQEIRNDEFKKTLLCKLSELSLLNH